MTDLTLMTFASDPATVLPSLALLSHRVRVLPMDAASLVKMPENTILFLDARDDLATAKTLCRLIHASGLSTPIVLILTEGGFTVVNSQWGIADVVVASASPAEVEGVCVWCPNGTMRRPARPLAPASRACRTRMA